MGIYSEQQTSRRIKAYKENIIKKRGSLAIKNPSLAAEWHPTFNGNLTPSQVTEHSGNKVWWKCSVCGNEWEASVAHRSNGRGCPKCSKRTIAETLSKRAAVSNSLKDNIESYPWIKEWNNARNIPDTIDTVPLNSHKKEWWICSVCGYQWQVAPHTRVQQGVGCPRCGLVYQTSEPELVFRYYLSKSFVDLISSYQETWMGHYSADIYIPSIKLAIEYDGRLFHADAERDRAKDAMFRQYGIEIVHIRESGLPELENESVCFVSEKQTDDLSTLQQPFLALAGWIKERYGIAITTDFNPRRDYLEIIEPIKERKREKSLGIRFPELLKEWDYSKNTGKDPFIIASGSTDRVWWKCSVCGNEWETILYSRTTGDTGCPICNKQMASKNRTRTLIQRRGSLAQNKPEIAAEWDYEANYPLRPDDVTCGSNKIVNWKCKYGHKWAARISSRGINGCPICRKGHKG